jgi:uncharacterized membrane protein
MMNTDLSMVDRLCPASTTLKTGVPMKTLIQHQNSSNPITGKRLAVCAILAALSVWSMPAAFAEHGHGQGGREGGRGHEGWHGDHDRGHGGYRGGYGYGGGYGYAQPVYVPPPVYVVPQQSPGINLVVPLNLRF